MLDIQDLKTWFPIKRGILSRTVGHVRAVDGVSLHMAKGQTLGLVGESGCGKSTLGRTLLGLETARSGTIRFYEQDLLQLRRREFLELRQRIQIIFQDPLSALNPRMNVLDILTEGLTEFKRIRKKDRQERAKALLGEVGLGPDALYRYPHEFSGGQRQRINIARAVSLRPDFIICDEPVSALDVSVQAQVINLLLRLKQELALAYLFISHDLSVVRHIADRVAVMYLGRIVEEGPTDAVIQDSRHPYTQALIAAVPEPGVKKAQTILPGETPSPANPPAGCRFHPRCPRAMDICRKSPPAEISDGSHRVCCHLHGPSGGV